MARPLALAATTLAVLLPAAPALAAPDRSLHLGTAEGLALTASWSGVVTGLPRPSALNGTPVPSGRLDNDETLVRIDEPGTLTVVMSGGDPGAVDVDLELFAANAAGEPQGERLVVSNEIGNDELVDAVTTTDEPAYFLVRAYGYIAAQGTVSLAADFVPKPRPAA
jgi:hypothetical protein